jgi:hypothetical protein
MCIDIHLCTLVYMNVYQHQYPLMLVEIPTIPFPQVRCLALLSDGAWPGCERGLGMGQ